MGGGPVSRFVLCLYDPGPNVFTRDVVVSMDPSEAAEANRAACRMRLDIRWWPTAGPVSVVRRTGMDWRHVALAVRRT